MLNRSASLAMSTSVLKALPGKLDIKRHSPSILYLPVLCAYICTFSCNWHNPILEAGQGGGWPQESKLTCVCSYLGKFKKCDLSIFNFIIPMLLIWNIFSSPEPKAPRWAIIIPVTPASVFRPSVRQHFQTSSPLKPLGQLNSNFIWRLLRMGEQKFVQMVLVTWPKWPPCPYMVKAL